MIVHSRRAAAASQWLQPGSVAPQSLQRSQAAKQSSGLTRSPDRRLCTAAQPSLGLLAPPPPPRACGPPPPPPPPCPGLPLRRRRSGAPPWPLAPPRPAAPARGPPGSPAPAAAPRCPPAGGGEREREEGRLWWVAGSLGQQCGWLEAALLSALYGCTPHSACLATCPATCCTAKAWGGLPQLLLTVVSSYARLRMADGIFSGRLPAGRSRPPPFFGPAPTASAGRGAGASSATACAWAGAWGVPAAPLPRN